MKKHFFVLSFCFLLVYMNCFSQQVEIKNYSFLNLEKNNIIFYGQSENMFKPLSDKFRSMIITGKQQINVLHLGDSHLQADLMSGEIRKNFQSFLPGLQGSRGMVTPYMRNCPDSYKLTFSKNWHPINILSNTDNDNKGLWAYSVYTDYSKETININVNNKNPIEYDFNSFRVYHSDLTEGDNLKINSTNVAYREIYNKESGYTEYILSDYVSSIEIEIRKKSQERFYIYGFYFQNEDAGVVYNVVGINGASAFHYSNNAKLFTKQLSTLDFDFMIISLGTNDTYEPSGATTFENNLNLLVYNIRNIYPNIPILLTTPTECFWHRKKINPRMSQTISIIKSVAEKNNCALLDLYNVLGGENSAEKLQAHYLMQKDLVHLTKEGYILVGDLIYNALWFAMINR